MSEYPRGLLAGRDGGYIPFSMFVQKLPACRENTPWICRGFGSHPKPRAALPNFGTGSILRFFCAAFFAGMVSLSGQAADRTSWTGETGSDWNQDGNWSHGLPAPGINAMIQVDGAQVEMTGGGAARNLILRAETPPELLITGDMEIHEALRVGGHSERDGFGGVVRHVSGSVVTGLEGRNRDVEIAAQSERDSTNSGNSGEYHFGGESTLAPAFTQSGRNVVVGLRPGERGLLSLSDHGSFNVNGAMYFGRYNGRGEFRVEGGNLDIRLNTGGQAENDEGLTFSEHGGGRATLTVVFTESGISTIHVNGNVRLGGGEERSARNHAVFQVEVKEGFSPEPGEVFTILDITGEFTGFGNFVDLHEGGFVSAAGTDFQVSYENGKFTLTYVE